jgi:F-type H+-transporting ATPase subunit gamma
VISDTAASLRRKIISAGDLRSIVRTMKALTIGRYEQSVRALANYYRTVELRLGVCFRDSVPAILFAEQKKQTVAGTIGTIEFTSVPGTGGPV